MGRGQAAGCMPSPDSVCFEGGKKKKKSFQFFCSVRKKTQTGQKIKKRGVNQTEGKGGEWSHRALTSVCLS